MINHSMEHQGTLTVNDLPRPRIKSMTVPVVSATPGVIDPAGPEEVYPQVPKTKVKLEE